MSWVVVVFVVVGGSVAPGGNGERLGQYRELKLASTRASFRRLFPLQDDAPHVNFLKVKVERTGAI